MNVGSAWLPPRLVMLVSFGGTSVLNYGFGLVMGWLLLPGDFGWLAFAQTVLLVAGLVLQTGFTWSLTRAIANAAGDRPKRDALVRGGLVANLALAAVMGAGILGLFGAGPLQNGMETWTVSLLVALSFAFIALAATARGCAQGSERFDMVAGLQVTEIFCKVLSGVALVLLGFGVTGAVAGFLIGAVLATVLGFLYLVRGLGVRLWGYLELPATRIIGPMFAALLGLSLLLNMDLAALKLLSDERDLTGYYQAGLVLANAPYYLVMTALVPVLFVELSRVEDVAATRKAMAETLALTAALVLPMELVLAILPEQMLQIFFPDSYTPGAPYLRLLAAGNALLILAGVFSAAFQAIGRPKVPAGLILAVVLVEPVALWLAVPSEGPMGAAVVFVAASTGALTLLVAAYLWGLGRKNVRRAVPWLLRYTTAAGIGAAAGGFAYAASRSNLLAVAVGGICYLAAVLPLRLVSLPPALREKLPLGKRLSPPVAGEED